MEWERKNIAELEEENIAKSEAKQTCRAKFSVRE